MAAPIPVADPDDPRLEPYRAIRERDLVGRRGRFVIEGEVVLRAALAASRFPLESLLLAENQAARLAGLVAALPAGVPAYVAPTAVLQAAAGFAIHRGVLAVGLRGAEPSVAGLLAALPARALVLGLVGLANHDNVGACFRNAAALGADAVVMDGATCDPLYRKAIRVSAGAALRLPFARAPDAGALLDALAAAGFEALALSPRGAERLEAVAAPARAALLLGAEGPGLSGAVLARCRTLRVAMAPGTDSLNVAAAGAVALHRLAGARLA